MFYVVTKGNYSDYHIVAVTTDRDVAEQICNKFSGEYFWDEARIEEYLDGKIMLRPAWTIYFDKSGNVTNCCACNDEYDYEYVGQVIEMNHDKGLIVGVFADTKEAAIKIAAEKRAMYLAEKNGI